MTILRKRTSMGLALFLLATAALLLVGFFVTELGLLVHSNSQASFWVKNGYGVALGAMMFVMLCISALLGYRFALTKDSPVTVQHLTADLLHAQKTLDKLSETHADLLWVQDLEGIYASCSMAFAAHVGIAHQKLIGTQNEHLLGVHNASVMLQYHQAVLTGAAHTPLDVRLTSAQDDCERIFEIIKTPLLNDRGKLVGIQSIARDVTQRREQEGRLKDALDRLRLLQKCVDHLNDVILITEAEPVDQPGPRIVYVNPAFERMTGYSSDEVLGKTPRILQGPHTQLREIARIKKALKGWKSVRAELINYTKSGREFWVELNISPVADETGFFTHWVSVQREITDRKM